MIDINKKYRTRAGAEVRIYSIDSNNLDTVHGAHLHKGQWMVASWSGDEARHDAEETPMDLIEVKPRIKRTVWANLYLYRRITLGHLSKEDADKCADRGRLACVKVEIDCEEGEGL